MFTGLVGEALQRSDTSCEMSRDDSPSISSYLPFLISRDAIALAETAQGQGERHDLSERDLSMSAVIYLSEQEEQVLVEQ